MKGGIGQLLSFALAGSPLQFRPVAVKAGLAKGARWTVAPFPANWRYGDEVEIAAALALLPRARGPLFVLSVHCPPEREQARNAIEPFGYGGTYADGRICRRDDPPESAGIIFTC